MLCGPSETANLQLFEGGAFLLFFGLWVLYIFLVFVPRLLGEEADGSWPTSEATSSPLRLKAFMIFFSV
ncbi:hypothetical protein [Marmot herpesvirus 1]|nr:hypothetical protein [Marmot herpesvirus 1]